MDANATQDFSAGNIGGFMCNTTGTLTLQTLNPNVTLLTAFPVEAGRYYPFPIYTGSGAIRVTLAGGASGMMLA